MFLYNFVTYLLGSPAATVNLLIAQIFNIKTVHNFLYIFLLAEVYLTLFVTFVVQLLYGHVYHGTKASHNGDQTKPVHTCKVEDDVEQELNVCRPMCGKTYDFLFSLITKSNFQTLYLSCILMSITLHYTQGWHHEGFKKREKLENMRYFHAIKVIKISFLSSLTLVRSLCTVIVYSCSMMVPKRGTFHRMSLEFSQTKLSKIVKLGVFSA